MTANQKPHPIENEQNFKSMSEVSEEKIPRVEQGIALILIASATPDATVPEPGTFHENTELHFSHPIQVLHPIVRTARKSHLALLYAVMSSTCPLIEG
ncbi:hypothetical protein DAPPUDRAFT_318201 [Daphnia pulex]|uniref:Uncharacterized protein n=1 Tax=Daphnia pulex TaxID=6669 RepID=E9GI45_DAPPU|nr:hypothetical protein DAPPUDRAFT_318201 [Daphnia pulex]|eukprot:EFX80834.1 hypothetical protein DAPPUDRAFT_318201 [Daphnia pulex]